MKKCLKLLATTILVGLASAPAHADWACEVILCLANPQGPTAVAQCVPPINKLWSELAKGHGFPFCDMSGGGPGNNASHQWASGDNCPPQYQYWGGKDQDVLKCSYTGVVSINLNNKPYNRVWWNGAGSVTENLSPQAINTPSASKKFEQDYAAWKAEQDAIAAAAAQNNN